MVRLTLSKVHYVQSSLIMLAVHGESLYLTAWCSLWWIYARVMSLSGASNCFLYHAEMSPSQWMSEIIGNILNIPKWFVTGELKSGSVSFFKIKKKANNFPYFITVSLTHSLSACQLSSNAVSSEWNIQTRNMPSNILPRLCLKNITLTLFWLVLSRCSVCLFICTVRANQQLSQ